MVLDHTKFEHMAKNYPGHVRPNLNSKILVQRQFFRAYIVGAVCGTFILFGNSYLRHFFPLFYDRPNKTFKIIPDYANGRHIVQQKTRTHALAEY